MDLDALAGNEGSPEAFTDLGRSWRGASVNRHGVS